VYLYKGSLGNCGPAGAAVMHAKERLCGLPGKKEAAAPAWHGAKAH